MNTDKQVESRWVQRFEGSIQLQRSATFLAVHGVHRSTTVSSHSLCDQQDLLEPRTCENWLALAQKLGIIQGMEERLREKFGAGGGERHAGRLIVPAAFIPGL